MNKMEYVSEGGVWDQVHPTLKLLLKRLLNPDPKSRIVSSLARMDSWVLFWDMKDFNQVECGCKHKNIDKFIYKNVYKYMCMNRNVKIFHPDLKFPLL